MSATTEQLQAVVAELADGYKWNWTRASSHRDAADAVLHLLAKHGIIEEKEHELGGLVWRVGSKLYGRTDGVTNNNFYKLETP